MKHAKKFRGNEALLSGPAGGVVGIAKSCFDQEERTPLIGFDMGGTSTDVSRFDGKYDYLTETTIAGRPINVPMLNIATVAAIKHGNNKMTHAVNRVRHNRWNASCAESEHSMLHLPHWAPRY